MNFRDNLVHLRAVNNMTQEQLAMLLGVSRQSVTKWESGKTYPEIDKLISLCQIFDCTLDELVQGDLSSKEANLSCTSARSTKPEDLFGYDEQMRTFANKISAGVMAIILGVAFCTFFVAIGQEGAKASHASSLNPVESIGILLLFAGIALGLWLIIPAGLSHSAFVKAHPFIADFYSPEQKEQARTQFSRELILGICCIFAGVCLTIFLASTNYEETIAASLMLLLVAIGVRFIIHGAMMLGRTNLNAYNEQAGEILTPDEIAASDLSNEQKSQMMEVHKKDKRVGAICGSIMMIATIIGLVMLFVPGYQNSLFWLAWPIGGLLCGISAVLIKGFSR